MKDGQLTDREAIFFYLVILPVIAVTAWYSQFWLYIWSGIMAAIVIIMGVFGQ